MQDLYHQHWFEDGGREYFWASCQKLVFVVGAIPGG